MSKLTRREFLEDSMFTALTASAAAGLGLAPSIARAAESSSPNERLRVAILGLNGRGQTLLSEFMRRKDCEVVAVVDPDENILSERGVKVVEKSTGKRPMAFQDMRKAFDDPSIDIIGIATPNHWHSLAGIWAIQAGKDVYVEKPVSHNVSEGRRLVQAARKYQRICQAGTQCRTMSGTKDAIEFVLAGGIGEVKLARGLCYKRRPSIGPRGNYDVPASIDYSLWLGPAEEKPLTRPRFHYDWHWQWDYGNGDLGNQGIHQMDVARWGLGVSDLGQSVVSYGGRLGYMDAGETANTQVSIHNFGDKTLVFETRGLETDSLRDTKVGVILYGSRGYVVQHSYNHSAAFDLDGKLTQEFKGGDTGDHFANFIDAVRSRKHEDLKGEVLDGHISSALCHLGNVSYRLGENISVKEAQRRLDGNDEALETLERTLRHLGANKVDLAESNLQFGLQVALDGKKEVAVGEHAAAANPLFTRQYRAPFVVPNEKDV